MIVVWHRGGILVAFFYGLGLLLSSLIHSAFPWAGRLVGDAAWTLLLGSFFGGYASWRLGRYLNEDEEDKHRLYFVRMEVWGGVGLVGSLLIFAFLAFRGVTAHGESAPATITANAPAPRNIAAVSNTGAAGSYRVTAVIRSGTDPSRWLFEVSDGDGRRQSLHLGEQVDRWTAHSFTNGRLVFRETATGRMSALQVPRDH